MKLYLIPSLFIALILLSCKKDRVCKCTVITTGTTNTTTKAELLGVDTTVSIPLNTTNVNTITYNDVSKKKAKFNCFDKSEVVNESTNNGIPGIMDITITNTGNRVYDCELE